MVPKLPEPDIFNANCPTQQVLDTIANKWSVIVVYSLSFGTKRHSELQRQISGVSQKMLTQTLRNLERDGLVVRKVYPVVPPKVEYSLTPLGETLIEPLATICKWAETHIDEMQAARERYDNTVEH
ncbi:helix-turn-helix transcriptional regulator [Trichocoleus sp. FACHB-832]|uniref:winged helix-turn-helix transcriptional regulator n=1 Tax=Trichocoleus sp. FACHB-832 TaxID=2692875 RepID=UPI001682709D|nr:helix-turn-helix domain-containing protein [Trichocoleus sp. FACHB-832]MBD1907363.1 helix-turn-helix transcriptional regulator [Trichocoleus sp. FACHB-832]